MNVPWLSKSKVSKELVTAPVIVTPPAAPFPADDGVTVTVDVFTLGLSAAPLLEMPVPVTEYSHPVL